MTIYILPSTTADNDIDSASTSYSAARAGTGSKAIGTASGSGLTVGQQKSGPTFHVKQGFIQVVTSTIAVDDLVVSADWSFTLQSIAGAGTWTLAVRETDWGTAVDVNDFVPGGSLTALAFFGTAVITTAVPLATRLSAASGPSLLNRLKSPGPVRTVWFSERQRLDIFPIGDEFAVVNSANSADAPLRPALRVCTIPNTLLSFVSGASLQLTDGYHVKLEYDTFDTITLEDEDGRIATVPTGTGSSQFALQPALQAFALIRDASDNLYVIGPQGSAPQTGLLAQAYVKGPGHTWTARPPLAVTVPAYSISLINNVVGRWHLTSGAGHLMVLLSHTAGSGKSGQIAYATLSCAALLAGSGTALVETGADPAWLAISNGPGGTPPTNETGSSLDIAAPPGATFGAVYCLDDPGHGLEGRYTLTSAGRVDSSLSSRMVGDGDNLSHDADSKLRAVPIGTDRIAFCAAGTITVRNYSGAFLGRAILTDMGIATFPDAATLAASSAWDVVYDPASNKLWHYYRDATDPALVRRTGVDLATYQGDGSEILIIDESPQTILSVRAPRTIVDERVVWIDASDETGSATHFDSFNLPPSPPTLTPQSAFDASAARLFSWTFNDPNGMDTQAAYELRISNATTGASAYSSGKVTSTAPQHTLPGASIGNNGSWQWMVRTWDAADALGPFSALGAFTTTSAGVLTITSPAVDNAAGLNVDTVTVTWTVTGATQAQRRVKVVDTATGATLADTGFVPSTSMTVTISGLQSDVEYRIEVTAKDGSGVISSTGTRVVTPSYSSPIAPVITAVDSGEGYIALSVTNPAPTGDEPEPSRNDISRRPAGTEEWTRIAMIPPGGSYRDYTAASGQDYEYKATAVV